MFLYMIFLFKSNLLSNKFIHLLCISFILFTFNNTSILMNEFVVILSFQGQCKKYVKLKLKILGIKLQI